eukprot:PLAT5594.1.p2 GENE.PLAT5594.1~~PLAT5594.1.p2  ORF type:complete len:152 (+),score=45.10 PLAT5594.1:61-456(+)
MAVEGDDRAVMRVYLPTYIMTPDEDSRFVPAPVKAICKEELTSALEGKEYVEEEARELTLEISESIKQRVKKLNIPRYKIAVQVVISQMKQQGARVCSRGLWDVESDNYASEYYTNSSLWAVAMVFAAYCE